MVNDAGGPLRSAKESESIRRKTEETEKESEYQLFTDGSKTQTDDKGKWAYILYKREKRIYSDLGFEGVTDQGAKC